MAYEIPFQNFATELKPLISGIDVTYDIENIESSLIQAKDEIVDITGEDIYILAINHYNSADYKQPGFERLDELVKHFQSAIGNMGFYLAVPFLAVRVSNGGITRKDTGEEKTAYKYQQDALREELLKIAWKRMDKLFTFLKKEATKYKLWKSGYTFTTDDIVYHNSSTYAGIIFFTCDTNHTSGESFDDDYALGYWTDKPTSEIIFNEWTLSMEYTFHENMLFNSSVEFSTLLSVSNSAYFLYMLGPIIQEVIRENIYSRIPDWDGILERKQYNQLTDSDNEYLKRAKLSIAYIAMSTAILRFTHSQLPDPIRSKTGYEYQMAVSDSIAGSKLKDQYRFEYENKGRDYLKRLDEYIAAQKRNEDFNNSGTVVNTLSTERIIDKRNQKHFFTGI